MGNQLIVSQPPPSLQNEGDRCTRQPDTLREQPQLRGVPFPAERQEPRSSVFNGYSVYPTAPIR